MTRILLEYTPEELRALIDADFPSPHYGAAVERAEKALEVEEGSQGGLDKEKQHVEGRDA